ncbi:hypothetical protein NDU88_002509 [Pleurodeles waltl]|uniref:Uncharacterized protein n=1 Tax=Pleurodeles waltl TaxID=8319 RepID=A0AAV7LJ01_PLEWA|nr:hypothetical protein NDU88_002509 [Pleurodeles waltl]
MQSPPPSATGISVLSSVCCGAHQYGGTSFLASASIGIKGCLPAPALQSLRAQALRSAPSEPGPKMPKKKTSLLGPRPSGAKADELPGKDPPAGADHRPRRTAT